MKNFTKSFRKGERGQVLVLVALSLVALVAIIGLALDTGYMYVSYARLQRAVDAAALGATSEFKRNYNISELKAAAKQMLYMNLAGEFTEDAESEFSNIEVVTCDTIAADHGIPQNEMKARISELIGYDRSPYVCTDPLRKMVRVKATQTLKTFFISIAGITQVPVTIEALAEAATVDVVMAIDTSESMTKGWVYGTIVGDDSDPSQCNIYKSCSPFEDVKTAAKLFLSNLYFPYDRVGIVTFAKDATMELPLSDSFADIENTIDNLKVFEAVQACSWKAEDRPDGRENYPAVYGDAENPCRLYNAAGIYQTFDCGGFYGLTPDASACPSTNTADGIALGGAILTGDYGSTSLAGSPGLWPAVRDEALWVLLLLTDGAPNSAHDENGSRLCPSSESNYTWALSPGYHPFCRDNNTLARHCWSNSDVDCVNAEFPAQADYPYAVTNTVDQNLYDADDRARDMFDIVSRNSTLIFTIGMGSQTKIATKPQTDINGISPGIMTLQYGAYGTTNDMTNPNAYKGLYYYGNNSGDLTRIFLTIANNLATRINQ